MARRPEAETGADGGPDLATLSFQKFHDRAPSPQAAVDIFKGRWASRFPDREPPLVAGTAPHFTAEGDHRPAQAARAFGGEAGRLDGFRIVELGPLEGGHTYQLEGLGAQVVAIEANAEAYLKCLIAKEILGMRSRFMLGDFERHLAAAQEPADLVFACGVLYHMTQPLRLIERICRAAPRCYLWTHYYDAERCAGFVAADVRTAG